MPDLVFRFAGAHAAVDRAAPAVALEITVAAAAPALEIRAIALQVQVRIEAAQRSYENREEERLRELFGEPSLWGRTMRSLLWANLALNVPGFVGETTVEIALPCSFDLDVAAAKYLYGLQQGTIPLRLLFSGTLFHAGPEGELQVAPIPWSRELVAHLPVGTWREALERHYPDRAVLSLHRETFERLYRYRREMGLASWDAVLSRLLAEAVVERLP